MNPASFTQPLEDSFALQGRVEMFLTSASAASVEKDGKRTKGRITERHCLIYRVLY